MPKNPSLLKKQDYASDQEVRWCPGCGDYAILASVQKLFADMQVSREDTVFISGIGCAARFPYYMNTYGFHTIHGRAPAVATGLKFMRPDLSVWVVTGDGDALSIGGNHLLHILRRNLNINILLFNNRIYGLTKGQYSPTSETGKVTNTTPTGSIDMPVDPVQFALGAGASFVARAIDVDAKHLQSVMKAAMEHQGTSLIEIFQNCNIYNDGAFSQFATKDNRPDATVRLEHGKPLLFGKDMEKGIAFEDFQAKIVTGDGLSKALVYDAYSALHAQLVSQLKAPDYPQPVGVYFKENRPVYETLSPLQKPYDKAQGLKSLHDLLHQGQTWEVTNE